MHERKICTGFAERVISESLSDRTKLIIDFLVAFGIQQEGKSFTRTDAINAFGAGRSAWLEQLFSRGFSLLRSEGVFHFCRFARKWHCRAELKDGAVTIPSKEKQRHLLNSLLNIRAAVEETYEIGRIEFALGRELTAEERDRYDSFDPEETGADANLNARIKDRLRAQGMLQ